MIKQEDGANTVYAESVEKKKKNNNKKLKLKWSENH